MILSKRTRNRISALANFLDRMALRLRRFVRDTTPKRAKSEAPTEAEIAQR
jgi:hypothetical protein